MAQIQIFRFGPTTDGDASMKNVLGGKGAGLAEMSKLGIPVPPGFTIPCSVSVAYQNTNSSKTMPAFVEEVMAAVIDEGMVYLKKQFGYSPLVSVRSGARVSMPGMMDTILNVGMTSQSLPEWEKRLGKRAALDSYRRLIQMMGSVALEVDMKKFEALLEDAKAKAGVKTDSELTEDHLTRLIGKYLQLVESETSKPFPDTFADQLRVAVFAVFDSWNNPRAEEYRKIHGIPFEWGTSATIQSMVFGNMDDKSCTGVLFTRDPSTGANKVTGEYLVNAQGEDVVAGIRTPEPFDHMLNWSQKAHDSLISVCGKLEKHYKDVQDIEFTVQSGKLYLLQTRTAKRASLAAFKIAHDLCVEGVLTQTEALQRVTQAQLFSAMSDTIDPNFKTPPALTGIAAGGGVVTGVAVFTSDDAVNCTEPCILVTKETDPDDIAGMAKSIGILTATGGLTSHAAVVARGMNKSCVVGATELAFTPGGAVMGGKPFTTGHKITIDGATGRVWFGDVPVVTGGGTPEVLAMMTWAFDAKQVSHRVELHGLMSTNDMMIALSKVKAQKVHIDLASLENEKSETPALVGALGTALHSSCDAAEIFIDVRPLSAYHDEYDRGFFKMFGLVPSFAYGWLPHLIAQWPEQIRQRCTLLGGSFLPNDKKVLLQAGFKLGGTLVKSFHDLAMAQGTVEVSDDVIQSVFGGQEGYELALQMIEKTSGKKLKSPAKPAYWYDLIGG